ncbi:NACHT domain-containing protein [Kibdelosporangium aridum]|uniref:NACHT domain-containing protein n=1 Tax=Kibdelosporangium aridum TaxID=2030 RepID=UPI00135A2757|nr:NACHT domain-containing protein [Kibdelosporangium aridum]
MTAGLIWLAAVDKNIFTALGAMIGTAVTAVGTISAWQNRRHDRRQQLLDKAVEKLVTAVTLEMKAEEKLRRLQDPWPLRVRWVNTRRPIADHWQAIHGVPERDHAIDLSGKLEDVATVLGKVPSQRLVVLGEPGSGKTILSLCLVLGLLDRRKPQHPVPVRIPVSSWDPVDVGLREWMAGWLSENYRHLAVKAPSGDTLAQELVAAGQILPVLDGLDEIPQPSRLTALVKLNRELSRGDPLVLTCRAQEYEEVVTAPTGDVLTAAAVVELCPLDPHHLADYLRVTTPQARVAKWDPVLQNITGHPDGPVAQALSTPLMAWLARTAYSETPAEPIELVATDPSGQRSLPTREDVEGRLVDRLIPTVYAPDTTTAVKHRWAIADAERWLGFLAQHLHRLGTYDLAWWRLHQAVSRLVYAVLFAVISGLLTLLTLTFTKDLLDPLIDPVKYSVVTALAVGLAVGLAQPSGPARTEAGFRGAAKMFLRRFTLGFAIALPLGFPFPLVTGLAAGLALSAEPAQVRIHFRGTVKSFARRFAFGFVIGAGMGYGWTFVLAPTFAAGSNMSAALVSGLIIGLASGMTVWLNVPADVSKVTTPKATLKHDRSATLVSGLLMGLTGGAVIGLLVCLMALDMLSEVLGPETVAPMRKPVIIAIAVAALAVLFGLLLAAVITMTSTWGIFVISRVWLAARRRIPWRFMGFLADAHQLGVLRQVGGMYQFRHARLHDRLVAHASQRRTAPSRVRGHRQVKLPAWARTSVGVVLVSGLLGVLYLNPSDVLSVTADESAGPSNGFLRANSPSSPAYRPTDRHNPYLHNSAQRPITVLHPNVGEYVVMFDGITTSGGVAHVTAYGGTSTFCVIGNWAPQLAVQVIEVHCSDADGNPRDARFVVNFADKSDGNGRFSYLLANDPVVTERYEPQSTDRYDSTGGEAWIARQAEGRYDVYVPGSAGIAPEEQFYQVTAVANIAHCKLSALPSTSGIQHVACRNTRGEFADSAFSLSFSWNTSFLGRTDRRYGHQSTASVRKPRWLERGQYEVRLPGIGTNGGQVVASAIGPSDAYCHVQGWGMLDADMFDADMFVVVKCWSTATHEPVDAEFTVGVTW